LRFGPGPYDPANASLQPSPPWRQSRNQCRLDAADRARECGRASGLLADRPARTSLTPAQVRRLKDASTRVCALIPSLRAERGNPVGAHLVGVALPRVTAL